MAERSSIGLEDDRTVYIRVNAGNAFDPYPNLARIGTGAYDEVILEPRTRAVKHNINTGPDASVSNLLEALNLRAPILALLSQEVVRNGAGRHRPFGHGSAASINPGPSARIGWAREGEAAHARLEAVARNKSLKGGLDGRGGDLLEMPNSGLGHLPSCS